MLKKLRRKIILLNLSLVSAVLLLTTLIICVSSIRNTVSDLFLSLQYHAEQDFRDEDPDWIAQLNAPPETPAAVPHLAARLDLDGNWYLQYNNHAVIATDTVNQALELALQSVPEEGFLSELNLAYVCRQLDDGVIVVLANTRSIRTSINRSLFFGLIAFFSGMAICYVISLYLSGVAIRPIETAWRQQKQFIADASHELKTPLTVILANHNIIASHGNETVAQQIQWLNATAEEAESMRLLIDEMLTLAKAEDEQLFPHLQHIDISSLIEEEVLFLEPVAYEAEIPLDARIQKNLTMETDPQMLKKLVVILVDNAVKHGRAGSPVTITLTGPKPKQFSVHNYGAPIPEEDLPHVFDRFYRSDKSRSTEGHGLGLAIAQSIAQKLQAELTVTSSEQWGTTFTVIFR